MAPMMLLEDARSIATASASHDEDIFHLTFNQRTLVAGLLLRNLMYVTMLWAYGNMTWLVKFLASYPVAVEAIL